MNRAWDGVATVKVSMFPSHVPPAEAFPYGEAGMPNTSERVLGAVADSVTGDCGAPHLFQKRRKGTV